MSKFNLLSYIMPPEDKLFFTYFQESAATCQKTANLYNEILQNSLTEEYKENALAYKIQGKESYKAVLQQLNKSFITPIEREDIQTIAVQLNKINKKIAKACLNLEIYGLESLTDEMKEQAQTLLKATDKLAEIIANFEKVSDIEKITALSIEMKEIESLGDEILRRGMKELFSGKFEALEIFKYRAMYKEIENIFDACYSVSDTILNVALKQN